MGCMARLASFYFGTATWPPTPRTSRFPRLGSALPPWPGWGGQRWNTSSHSARMRKKAGHGATAVHWETGCCCIRELEGGGTCWGWSVGWLSVLPTHHTPPRKVKCNHSNSLLPQPITRSPLSLHQFALQQWLLLCRAAAQRRISPNLGATPQTQQPPTTHPPLPGSDDPPRAATPGISNFATSGEGSPQ